MAAIRVAVVTADLAVVQRYLPSNYQAKPGEDGRVLIVGTDSAGWTLDDYVIPRLASGGMYAKEIVS